MARRLIVGISGAPGVLYGIRTLKVLRKLGVETHLVLTAGARAKLASESDRSVEQVKSLPSEVHSEHNLGAAIASGSFLTDGMLVAPCSVKTLSGIADSYDDNLLVRAADVVLKEQRRLVLMVRESPLHAGHLRLMSQATENGAIILPPMPAFYHGPQTIADIVDHGVGKALDQFGLDAGLFPRWEGIAEAGREAKRRKGGEQ